MCGQVTCCFDEDVNRHLIASLHPFLLTSTSMYVIFFFLVFFGRLIFSVRRSGFPISLPNDSIQSDSSLCAVSKVAVDERLGVSSESQILQFCPTE